MDSNRQSQSPHPKHQLSPQPPPNGIKRKKNERGQSVYLSQRNRPSLSPAAGPSNPSAPTPQQAAADSDELEYEDDPPVEPPSNQHASRDPTARRQFHWSAADDIYTPSIGSSKDVKPPSQNPISPVSSIRSSQLGNFQPRYFRSLDAYPVPSMRSSEFGSYRPQFFAADPTPNESMPAPRFPGLLSPGEIEILTQMVDPSQSKSVPSPHIADIPASQKAPYTLDNEVSQPNPPAPSQGPPRRSKPIPDDSPSQVQITRRPISPQCIPPDDEEVSEPTPVPDPAIDTPLQKRIVLPALHTPLRQLKAYETLSVLNLRFNELYKVPYCNTCAKCFWSTSISGHVQKCWSGSKGQPKNLKQLILAATATLNTLGAKGKAEELQLHIPDTTFPFIITPFEGVRTDEQYPCPHCPRAARSNKALREHYRLYHPETPFTPCLITRLCQTPFPAQSSPVFQVYRVILPNEDGPSDHDVALYGYEESKARFDPVVVTHEGLRHNSHFLEFSNLANWAVAQALTVGELLQFRSMTNIPQGHQDPWYHLAHHISSYFQDIVALWSTENECTRKHLRSDKPVHIAAHPLDDFEETDTFRKYVNKWVKLFIFLRNQRQAEEGHRLKFVVLTAAQATAVDTLIQLFTPGATFEHPQGTPAGSPDIVPTPIPAPTPAPQGNTSKRQARPSMTVYETAVAQAIHNLSIQLIQHSYTSLSVQGAAIVMFVAALALEASGSWDDGRNVSPKLSGLIWCFRTVSFRISEERIRADPCSDPDKITDEQLIYLHITKPTPFEWIRSLAKRITNAIGYLPKVPRLYVDERGSLLIDNHSISFDQLCQLAQLTRTRFKESLEDVFRFIGGGAREVMDWDWKPDEIADRWACPASGYSFLFDPKNDRLNWPSVNYLRDCLIKSKQFHTRSEATVTWDVKKIQQLNHLLRQAMVWSIVAIHTTSGGTSRGTEITSHRRRNGTRQRNFFWYHSRFLVLGLYHKGSHSGRDKFLPRTVDPELSIWLLILHRLFPELQHFIHVQILKTDAQVAHRFYEEAYFDGYRQLDRNDVNWGLGEASEPIIGTRLTISVYRHIVVELHKETLLTAQDSKLLQAVIDAHSAHSSATAEANYAITPEDQVASRELIRKFVLISIAHQKLLGLPTDGEASIIHEMKMVPDNHSARTRMADAAPPRPDGNGPLQRSFPGASTGLTFRDLKDAVQLPMDVFKIEIQGWMDTLQQVINRTSKELEAARLGREIRVDLPDDLLQALRTSRQLTRFKSKNQAKLAQLSRDRQTNVGGFISTNAGKTLAVTLPSHPLLNPHHRTTIIAVPYTALQLDIYRRRDLFKDIEIVIWDPDNPPAAVHSPEIVVATFDALLTPQLQTFCQELGSRLARLVIDEAHIVILDRTWRQSLVRASEWRQLDCPVTLLAGIMTRPLLDELKLVFALHTPLAIVEEPPHRPEIRYSSIAVEDKVLGTHTRDIKALADIVRAQLENLKGEEDRLLAYVTSRQAAEDLAEELECEYYHAGLSTARQIEVSVNWRKGVFRILICTKAYGTGIDFPCVRVVIHLDLPDTMFDWLQETGRAGRDGLPAIALTVYPKGAVKRLPATIPHELVLGGKRELVYGILSGTVCYRAFSFEFLGYGAYSCAFYGGQTQLCDRCQHRQGRALPPTSGLVSAPSAAPFINNIESRAPTDAVMQSPRPRTVSAPAQANAPSRKFPNWCRPIDPDQQHSTAFESPIPVPSPHTPGTSLGTTAASTPLLNYTPSSTYHQAQVVHNHFYAFPHSVGSQPLPSSDRSTTMPLPSSNPDIQPRQFDSGRTFRRPNDSFSSSHKANPLLLGRKPAMTAATTNRPTASQNALRDIVSCEPEDQGIGHQDHVFKGSRKGRPIPPSWSPSNPFAPAGSQHSTRLQLGNGNPGIQKPASTRTRPEHFRASTFFRQDLGKQAGRVANANSESATVQRALNAGTSQIQKVREHIRTASQCCLYCWIVHKFRDASHTAFGANACPLAANDTFVRTSTPPANFFGQARDNLPKITFPGCCAVCRTPWLCSRGDSAQPEHENKDIILPVVALGHIFLRQELLTRLSLAPSLTYQEFRAWCMGQSPQNANGLIHNLHEAFLAVFEVLEAREADA